MLRPPWVAANKNAPCPICGRCDGRDDWCIFIPGQVAICHYIESKRTSKDGSGWVHFLGQGTVTVLRQVPTPPTPRRNDLHILAEKFRTGLSPTKRAKLARDLRLSEESLVALDVGWCAGEPMFSNRLNRFIRVNAWSFPMRDPDGKVTGIRMRSNAPMPDGSIAKFSFTGGAGGLFIPRGLTAGQAFLLEGPTDTAAALDIGLNAFGRESCSAGVELVKAMLKKWLFDELIIFSQRDPAKPVDKRDPKRGIVYAAQRGAATIAGIARRFVPIVRVIMPPDLRPGHKTDVRDWHDAGARAADVEQLIAAAPPVELVARTMEGVSPS